MILDHCEHYEEITEIANWKAKVQQIFDEISGAGKSSELILEGVKNRLKGRYGQNEYIIEMSFDDVLKDYKSELQRVPNWKPELEQVCDQLRVEA